MSDFNLTPAEWSALEKDLSVARQDEIVVFSQREVPGLPDDGKPSAWAAQSCTYRPIAEAINTRWDTDCHTAAYYCPEKQRRLNYDALGTLQVEMHWAIFDIDCPDGHKEGGKTPSSWREEERVKVEALLSAHPGVLVYHTRGGYRVMARLPAPIEITSRDQAVEEWTPTYLSWVHYLERVFGIVADPACKEWNRLYRLPRATRDKGGKPENYPIIGDPSNIGTWAPELTQEDILAAVAETREPRVPREYDDTQEGQEYVDAGNGIFYELFASRGLILKDAKGGGKWWVTCPLADQHGHTGPTDTFLGRPNPGEKWGHVHCSHSSHGHHDFTWSQWRACFSEGEISAARERLGLNRTRAKVGLPMDEDELALGGEVVGAEVVGTPSEFVDSSSTMAGAEAAVAVAVNPEPAEAAPEPVADPQPKLRLVSDNPNPTPEPSKEWIKLLDRKPSAKGKAQLMPTRNNVELFLRNADPLKGMLLYNEIKGRVCFARKPPSRWIETYPSSNGTSRWTPWTDMDTQHLDTYLSHPSVAGGIKNLDLKKIRQAVDSVAYENKVNPILEYLQGLTWDGVPRVETWLTKYLQVEDTEYSRLVGPWWLLGSVARGCDPGEKVDNILVLEGEQGVCKSTALEILGGEYYSNADLGDLKSKESALLLQGVWILELAEGEIFGRASTQALKAFSTKTKDDVIKKYQNDPTRIVRSATMALTINEFDFTFADSTGNRRFLPVTVLDQIDLELLKKDRDQLWAETYQMYIAGVKWYPQTAAEKALCRVEQAAREVVDAWLDKVEAYITGVSDEVKITSIVDSGVEAKWMTQAEAGRDATQKRVAKCLRKLGWKPDRESTRRFWVRGPGAEPYQPEVFPDLGLV